MRDSGNLTLGELACLTIVVWRAWRGEDVSLVVPHLRPQHKKQLELMLCLLDATMKMHTAGKLDIPRFIPNKKQARALGSLVHTKLQSVVEQFNQRAGRSSSAFPSRDSHWETIAYLLVFAAQLERNKSKCQDGARIVHVDVHCLAIFHALLEDKDSHWASIIRTFLKQAEVDKIEKSLERFQDGQDFTSIVAAEELDPSGLRDILRRLLDIKEVFHQGKKLSSENTKLALDVAGSAWDAEADPSARLIRVSGIVHERVIVEELSKMRINACVLADELQEFSDIDIANFLFEEEEEGGSNIDAHTMNQQTLSHKPKEKPVEAPFVVSQKSGKEVEPKSRNTIPRPEPRSFDLLNGVCFCLIMGFLLLFLGRDTYALSVAWWHFSLGGLVVGGGILVGWPLLRWILLGESLEFV
jgi:hypothetical protein